MEQLDNDLDTIREAHIQFRNGYHMSKEDCNRYTEAADRVFDESSKLLVDYIFQEEK